MNTHVGMTYSRDGPPAEFAIHGFVPVARWSPCSLVGVACNVFGNRSR